MESNSNAKGLRDWIVNGCAIVGAVGTLLIALSLFLNWQTVGISNAQALGSMKESIVALTSSFHEFAVSADGRIRTVELMQERQQTKQADQEAAIIGMQQHLDQIEQASHAMLSPTRGH